MEEDWGVLMFFMSKGQSDSENPRTTLHTPSYTCSLTFHSARRTYDKDAVYIHAGMLSSLRSMTLAALRFTFVPCCDVLLRGACCQSVACAIEAPGKYTKGVREKTSDVKASLLAIASGS
eukprot:770294-Amphidinium_carterae.2